jgi:hypothetical protein
MHAARVVAGFNIVDKIKGEQLRAKVEAAQLVGVN